MPSLPYTGDGSEYDVVVGGVPFRLATASDMPQSIETVPVSKDQVDTERDPGEQSLAGFWRRSQASFHWGAGYLYEGLSSNDEEFAGFYKSMGCDVFTRPGQVTPVREITPMGSPIGGIASFEYRNDGVFGSEQLIAIASGGVDSYSYDVLSDTWPSYIVPPSGTWLDCVIKGDTYMTTSTSRLYRVSSAGVSAGYWSLTTTGTVNNLYVIWGKHRLWVYGQRDIFQPSIAAAPDNGAAPVAAFFTNPDPEWTYVAAVEGPQAMYFAGNDGIRSQIHMVTITDTGGLPTLTGAVTAAVMPDGELITKLAVVAGQLIGIGTNRGFRVGRIDGNGFIAFGPLIIDQYHDEDDPQFFQGVNALCPMDDSFLVAIKDSDSYPMVYRVDTSFELGELVYPYARDIILEDGATGNATWFNDLAVSYADKVPRIFALYETSMYRQARYKPVENAWIQTSRIRFRTTEPKAFKYANISALDGGADTKIRVDQIPPTGATVTGTDMTTQAETELPQTLPTDPLPYLSLKINLFGTAFDGPEQPTLYGFLVRALPASQPQRLITLPLLCFDEETTRSGQTYASKGWARQRLEALQAYEDTTATVTYARGETSGTLSCVIESVQFVQTSPPNPVNREGAGGILILKLRTVEP